MHEASSGGVDLAHHHYAISVPDLESSIRWYAAILGFEVERRFRVPAIGADAAMLRRGGLRVEVFQVPGAVSAAEERRDPHRDLDTHGNKHPAFAVDSLSAFLELMRSRRVDVAFVVPPEIGRACFLRDNHGNLIEFVERRGEHSELEK